MLTATSPLQTLDLAGSGMVCGSCCVAGTSTLLCCAVYTALLVEVALASVPCVLMLLWLLCTNTFSQIESKAFKVEGYLGFGWLFCLPVVHENEEVHGVRIKRAVSEARSTPPGWCSADYQNLLSGCSPRWKLSCRVKACLK